MKKYFLLISLIAILFQIKTATALAGCTYLPDGNVSNCDAAGISSGPSKDLTTPTTNTVPTPTPSPIANPTAASGCPNGGTLNSNGVCNLGYVPLEPIPGITDTNLTSPGGFANMISALFKILISAGALLAVLSLTIGGVQYMTASSIGNKTQGIERAKAAMYGILLIAATWLILNTINPHLLNFSFVACPPGNATCSATAIVNNNTGGAASAPVTQTVQVSADTAKQLGLVNNSVVLYNNDNATQANAAIAQSMNECQRYSGGFSNRVSGTAVGGTSNQSAEVCQQPTFWQSMTNALGN